MSRTQCELYPEVNGEPSKLYKDLLKKTKGNRPLTNLIYAYYLQQGVEAQMNSQGYKVNRQGQHDANAVYQFFGVASMRNESSKAKSFAIQIGARKSNGDLVDFTDGKDALQIAAQANSTSDATVSYVVRHGDKFNVITEAKDSRTQIRVHEVLKQQAVWQVIEQALAAKGIDINGPNFNKNLVNPVEGDKFLSWLQNIGPVRNDLLTLADIKTLLALDENSPQVQRLKTMFGTLDDIATKMYEAFRGVPGYTQQQKALMDSAISNCKSVQGLDIVALKQQVDQVKGSLSANSKEVAVQTTLEDLDNEYNLDIDNIHRGLNAPITKLQEVAAEAVMTLQRQLKKLKAEQGVTTEVKQLQSQIDRLTREIASKRYYTGILGFLSDALNQVKHMEDLFQRANQAPGTNLERGIARAKALMEIKAIMEGYEHIIVALTKIDDLLIDENISDSDKQNIKNQALAIQEFFNKYDDRIKELRRETMIDIASEYLGEETSNGTAIADIVSMTEIDATVWDHLYSIGRSSNPLIATMGNVIRDAQSERNKKLNDISQRIRRATAKLHSSGHRNTRFMYDPEGNYIISDIDWIAYNEARNKARARFINQGLRGLNLEEAMDNWQEANTEDRIVDYVNGRTERVPNKNYRKAFPSLTPAQQEYYNEMMQIKGELGSLLPQYAQKQYLPPQKRRSFIDAVAASRGNPIAIAKAIFKKLADLFVIRDDDPINVKNGIIEGEDYAIRAGALDNTPYRRIPIFYINRLKDQDELLKDFSGAMELLAGTAINYECMNKIKDTVEFMGDYINGLVLPPDEGRAADMSVGNGVQISKALGKKYHSLGALIEGFIDMHIYGEHLKKVTRWTPFLKALLAFTSSRALSANVKGMIANVVGGDIQMIIEAGGGEFYNASDLVWARTKILGEGVKPGTVMDFLSNNTNSKVNLLVQRFDPNQEEFQKQSHKRYFNSPIRKLISCDLSFIGYGAGEQLLHLTSMYAVLHNTKVKIDGKKSNLYDAFTVGDKSDGNSELLLKQGVTYEDENGNWVPVDEAFLDKIRDRVRYSAQSTFGSMNEEDKGLIHRHMMGRLAMNLRQWMVEHYSRRFRKSHWDASLREYREGYYNTVGKLVLSWASDLFNLESEAAVRWKDMDKGQKANVRRALMENALLLGVLLPLSFALGEPEDAEGEYWKRMLIYQTKRMISEVRGSTPYGLPWEFTRLVNSPIAATNTINSMLYVVAGIPDINETIKRGRYKGWNKYGANVLRHTVPYWNQVEQLYYLDEDPHVFAIFETQWR